MYEDLQKRKSKANVGRKHTFTTRLKISNSQQGRLQIYNKELNIKRFCMPDELDIFILQGYTSGWPDDVARNISKGLKKRYLTNDVWNKGLNAKTDPRLIKSPESKISRKETMINKYGYEHGLQVPHIFEKKNKTIKERYPNGIKWKLTEAQRLNISRIQLQNENKWMNKDNTSKLVPKISQEQYLSEGYVFGRTSPNLHTKNKISETLKLYNKENKKIWVHNDEERHMILEESLSTYLSNGYVRGKGKQSKTKEKESLEKNYLIV